MHDEAYKITKYRYSTNGSSWTETTSNPSQTNAGTLYTQAYYKYSNSNYCGEGWSSSATIEISKADQVAPTAYGATTTYPTIAEATTIGGGGKGSIEWSNGNTQTSVGSKTTKARWSGNSNYNASPWSNEVTVKMNKANQTISFDSSTGSVDVNHTLTKTATRSVGDGTVTYTSSNTSIAVVNSSNGVVTGVSPGTCTITATAAATTNYNSASAQYELSVKGAGTTVTLGFSYQGHTVFLIVGKLSTQIVPTGYPFTKYGQTYELAASTSAGATWSFTVTNALYTQNGTSYNLTCARVGGATITGTGSQRISFSYSAANKTWDAYLQ